MKTPRRRRAAVRKPDKSSEAWLQPGRSGYNIMISGRIPFALLERVDRTNAKLAAANYIFHNRSNAIATALLEWVEKHEKNFAKRKVR
jgi:hypothetical protein